MINQVVLILNLQEQARLQVPVDLITGLLQADNLPIPDLILMKDPAVHQVEVQIQGLIIHQAGVQAAVLPIRDLTLHQVGHPAVVHRITEVHQEHEAVALTGHLVLVPEAVRLQGVVHLAPVPEAVIHQDHQTDVNLSLFIKC